VAAVTDKNSKDYVEPADRIATFDNDGTLWVECYAVGLKHQRSDTLTLGVGLTFLWEGNLPIDDSGGVSGKYNNVSLSFLSFYASWH
jgi:hypothetical protein